MEPPEKTVPKGFIIVGLLSLLYGFILLPGVAILKSAVNLSLAPTLYPPVLLLSLLHIFLGLGFLLGKGWAWMMGIALSVVYLIVGVAVLLGGTLPLLLIVSALVLVYLTRTRIKSVFSSNSYALKATSRIALTLLLIAIVSAFTLQSISIGESALIPWGDLANVLAGVLLGPWYAVVIAIASGALSVTFANSSYFVFPLGIPGALAVGLARNHLPERRKVWAPFFEPLGTTSGFFVSLLFGAGVVSINLLGLVLSSSIFGALLGFFILRALYQRSSFGIRALLARSSIDARKLGALLLMIMLMMIAYARADFQVSPPITTNLLADGISTGFLISQTGVNSVSYANQNGMILYGSNEPTVYTNLKADLTNEIRCLGCPLYLRLVKVTETFSKLSTGAPILPVFDIRTEGTTASGYVYSPSPAVYAEWSNPWNIVDVGDSTFTLAFQIYLDQPDVYVVTVTSQAEVWINYGNIVTRLTSGESAYSFQYVYESDANSGGDTGSTPAGAYGIVPGGYTGLLYAVDNQDWYKFEAMKGDYISIDLTSPANSNFDLKLLDPAFNYVAGSFNGPGATDSINYQANSTGSWYMQIYAVSGWGTYNFSIGVTR